MAKFLTIARQSGGCDYTIGCGIAVGMIEADTIEAAVAIAINEYANIDDCGDETAESVKSIEVRQIHEAARIINNHEWMLLRQQAKASKASKKSEANDRKEFDRLKKKFGG